MNALTHYEGQAAIAELQRWQGVGLKPQDGAALICLPLGDSEAWVEYEYSPGTPGRYSGPWEDCYPADPEEVTILAVLINGRMVDVDVFAPAVLERWEQEIIDAQREDFEAAMEERAEREAEFA